MISIIIMKTIFRYNPSDKTTLRGGYVILGGFVGFVVLSKSNSPMLQLPLTVGAWP